MQESNRDTQNPEGAHDPHGGVRLFFHYVGVRHDRRSSQSRRARDEVHERRNVSIARLAGVRRRHLKLGSRRIHLIQFVVEFIEA